MYRTQLGPGLLADPWSAYRHLTGPPRPVVLPDGMPGWLITRYDEARALLDDRRLSKNAAKATTELPGLSAVYAIPLAHHMLHTDPPDHTRLRKLVNKAFTTRAVARLRPRVEQLTDELLDAMPAAGEVNLVEALTVPLPIAVISELLGVPHEDRARLRNWSRVFTSGAPADVLSRATAGLTGYLAGLVAAKRAAPGPDLLSDLVHVTEDGDRLSTDELTAMAALLLVAGHETTVSLIGNSVLALLRHPDQLDALRAEPGLLPGAIEEFLRFEGAIHIATLRFTTEPVPVGDLVLPAGEFVLISLLAANRDGKRFPEPGRLDLSRNAHGHLAFGHGIHYCVGAPLARMEAETALGRLLSRYPRITLAGEPDPRWRGSSLVHGLRELPVRLG